MNRVGMGLAVGAGYFLGRTRKMKLAFAVGTLVAGKRMHLSPRALADLVAGQLRDNPQFKEIGDQLREDLRGVGKAATGAMVERRIDALADRLHGRTAQVRDQLSGVVPDTSDLGFEDDEDDEADERDNRRDPRSEESEDSDADYDDSDDTDDDEPAESPAPRRRAPAKKSTGSAKKAAGKAPAKKAAKTAEKAPAKKAAKKTAGPARKTAKKTAAKKTSAAGDSARSARARLPKGGGER
ncbi:DNA primase [Streptomyces lincolnensis]|nr:DNA primase [Streptomyces lincolnensis]QMV10729.1 DNA primase [Streptomyces lincolnensis]